MTSLVFFIERIALGLYILSAAGLLWMAQRLNRARRELTVAQFKLEREQSQVRRATAITFGGLLIEFMIAVWAIAQMMAPTIRDMRTGESARVAALERFVTSTPASNAPVVLDTGGQQEEGPDIFATPVPTNTPVGTIIPEAADPVGCPRDSAWLHVPGNGQAIFEATPIIGTANVSDFSSYRFEIRQVGSDTQFGPIGGDVTVPVTNGPLGEIVPLNFDLGEYRFRLVVFDNTRTVRALCEITIHIVEPPTTPTPSPAPSDLE